MRSIEPWHIVVANLAVLAIASVVLRWHRKTFLGWFGIAIIVLPSVFAYFQGRLRGWEVAHMLVGIIILAADLTGRLPDRDRVRRKLFRRDSNVLR